MTSTLIDRVRRRFVDARAVPHDETWVVAVSGGADSTALVHVLLRLADAWRLRLVVAHLDHGLRPGSAADATFVRDMAEALGLDAHVGHADAFPSPGGSPEEDARHRRRSFLDDVRGRVAAERVALAHTADDQAETVLFRAASGTSIRGLAAMSPNLREPWIRPLLLERRSAVRRWLCAEGLAWREDPTNRQTDARRNRVRHDLLPLIEARLNARAVEALTRLADDARAVDAFVHRQAQRVFEDLAQVAPGRVALGAAALDDLDPVVRLRVIRRALEHVSSRPGDLTRAHTIAADALRRDMGELHLPGRVRAISEHGRLTITRGNLRPEPSHTVDADAIRDSILEFGATTLQFRVVDAESPVTDDPRVARFDLDDVSPPLTIRPWRPGDRLVPFGMDGRVKVSDLFIDRKIPRSARSDVPIVEDERGILWVAGLRRSSRARVGPNTRRVLRVRMMSDR